MKTFIYEESETDDGVTFHMYCADADAARAVVSDLQSIAGTALERDANFVYFIVSLADKRRARKELRNAGYASVESMSSYLL